MLYDYKCSKCEHVFEIRCPLAEIDYVRPCPQCESADTFRFFGSMPGAIPRDKLMGGSKIPDGFRDVLHSIADRTPGGHVMKGNIR